MCSKAPLKTLSNGLQALIHLAHHAEGCTSVEMADYLGIDRTSSFRILRTLHYCGFAYEEKGRYRISYKLFGLLAELQTQLADVARPVLKQLADETGYTATLALWEGQYVVPIILEKGRAPLIVNSNLGAPVPLHASALGKVMLAFQEELCYEELCSSLQLEPLTPHTITDIARLKAELRSIRKRGYATDHEEYRLGIRCVAFPIFNFSRRCMAAISLSYPATLETVAPAFEKKLIKTLRAAADNLMQRIGTRKEVVTEDSPGS